MSDHGEFGKLTQRDSETDASRFDPDRRAWLLHGGRLIAASAGSGPWLGLTGAAGMVGVAGLAGCAAPGGAGSGFGGSSGGGLRFKPVVIARDDSVHVPDGYHANVLLAWGDPVGMNRGLPEFRPDASNSADDQSLQAGMHNDGVQYFPLPWVARVGVAAQWPESASSDHGLLAINHEYPDDALLFPDGTRDWSLAKARKAQRALGISVIEVQRVGSRWTVQRPSVNAMRIHADSPVRFSGPAAGHEWMRTPRATSGRTGQGTFANAGSGWTPWGTYLSCEENFNYGLKPRRSPTPLEARYGLTPGNSDQFRWGDVDPRFDLERNPHEAHHFGWVVEIDPYDPRSAPVKRTALGRFKHESAAPAVARDGRVAFYMADEQAFEYLYKFVTRRPWDAANRAANRDLLDDGTLYVARFEADGSGRWIELEQGRNGLTAVAGFASQAQVLIMARAAADLVGGTRLDRGQWTAVDPVKGSVWLALTGNPERGQPGKPGVDAVNPQAGDRFGRLLRFDEEGGDAAAVRFGWRLADLRGDAIANPDALSFDRRGNLWIGTDISPVSLQQSDFAQFGNNQMLVVDPSAGEVRRFMTGPRGSELSGMCFTPDGTTLFVNVQHPGEAGFQGVDPNDIRGLSNWPDQQPDGRPRSATIAVRRVEGGPIGS